MFLRKAFDAVERPVAKASESLLETDRFMDALALTWRFQRSTARRVTSGTATALHACGLPTRGDVVDVVNQVAGLQRDVRELRREVEER